MPFSVIKSFRLKGHVLYFALILSLLIAILCGSVILIAHVGNKLVYRSFQKDQLLSNAQSGLNLIMANEIPVNETPQVIDLYGDHTDSVQISFKSWGLFEVGISQAFSGNERATKVALIGYKISGNQALYLTDHNRPISIAGDTKIIGDAALPEAGIKRAYIENKSFKGKKLVQGSVKKSGRRLPPLNESLFGNILTPITANTIDLELGISHSISHTKPTGVISCHDITLSDSLSGNILLNSSGTVTITEDAIINGIIIYSKGLVINTNFKGNLQAIITDSCILEKSVQLNYPSAIGIIKKEKSTSKAPFIKIGKESQLEGVLFAKQTVYDRQKTLIELDSASLVSGEIFTDGYLEIDHATIHGRAIANKLKLFTRSGSYENTLLDAVIDFSKLPEEFVGTSLIQSGEHKHIMKWLD